MAPPLTRPSRAREAAAQRCTIFRRAPRRDAEFARLEAGASGTLAFHNSGMGGQASRTIGATNKPTPRHHHNLIHHYPPITDSLSLHHYCYLSLSLLCSFLTPRSSTYYSSASPSRPLCRVLIASLLLPCLCASACSTTVTGAIPRDLHGRCRRTQDVARASALLLRRRHRRGSCVLAIGTVAPAMKTPGTGGRARTGHAARVSATTIGLRGERCDETGT